MPAPVFRQAKAANFGSAVAPFSKPKKSASQAQALAQSKALLGTVSVMKPLKVQPGMPVQKLTLGSKSIGFGSALRGRRLADSGNTTKRTVLGTTVTINKLCNSFTDPNSCKPPKIVRLLTIIGPKRGSSRIEIRLGLSNFSYAQIEAIETKTGKSRGVIWRRTSKPGRYIEDIKPRPADNPKVDTTYKLTAYNPNNKAKPITANVMYRTKPVLGSEALLERVTLKPGSMKKNKHTVCINDKWNCEKPVIHYIGLSAADRNTLAGKTPDGALGHMINPKAAVEFAQYVEVEQLNLGTSSSKKLNTKKNLTPAAQFIPFSITMDQQDVEVRVTAKNPHGTVINTRHFRIKRTLAPKVKKAY